MNSTIERLIIELREMEAMTVNEQGAAAGHGYTVRIPPQKAPFNSMGEAVFKDPKTGKYITPDRTGHGNPGGVWKMFDAQGNRIGTYDGDLQFIRK